MIVASFHTPAYAGHAERLRRSLEAFRLEYDIRSRPDLGSWAANNAQKADYLRSVLEARPGESVLWLDADSEVRRSPDLLPAEGYDVAAYFDGPWSPWGGTIWLAGNRQSWGMLDRWAIALAKPGRRYDWEALPEVLSKPTDLRVLRLPPAYHWIEANMRARFPAADPVVWHYAVGRGKGVVGNGNDQG